MISCPKGQKVKRIKPRRKEDPKHLAEVRALGCYACRMDGRRGVPAEAHHPRKKGQGRQKAPDSEAIPLCPRHHNEQHPDSLSIHRNPKEFRLRYGSEEHILDWVKIELGTDAEICDFMAHMGFREPSR